VDTIRSRLRDVGDSYRHHLPREELLRQINTECNTDTNGRAWGHRHVQSALTYVGVRATRTEVLEALRQ